MIFAAGFLAATLFSLLVIPAINRRAERLARRRVEALFPLSISELTAEKDHLRAEFAVMQRRLERRSEEAMAAKHGAMEELGRRAVRIHALETDLGQRDQAIAALDADLADTRMRLVKTEEELAQTRSSLMGTRDTLAALNDAHAKTLSELAQTRSELAETTANLAQTRTELLATQDRLSRRDTEYTDLDTRHAAALGEIDTRRITISDLETRLATQTARGDEFERALGDRRAELAEERQRLAELARNLLAEQERGLGMEQRSRALETERDAKAAELVALTTRLDEAKAEHARLEAALHDQTIARQAAEHRIEDFQTRMAALEAADGASGLDGTAGLPRALQAERSSLEGALALAREERSRLERELQTARQGAGNGDAEIRAENAALRQQMDELAERILQLSSGDRRDPAPDPVSPLAQVETIASANASPVGEEDRAGEDVPAGGIGRGAPARAAAGQGRGRRSKNRRPAQI